jgi:hypothetical protein
MSFLRYKMQEKDADPTLYWAKKKMQIGMPHIPRPSFPGSIGYSSYNKQNFGDQETENSNPVAATAAQTEERSATLSSSSCVCSPFCVFLLLPFFSASRRV